MRACVRACVRVAMKRNWPHAEVVSQGKEGERGGDRGWPDFIRWWNLGHLLMLFLKGLDILSYTLIVLFHTDMLAGLFSFFFF